MVGDWLMSTDAHRRFHRLRKTEVEHLHGAVVANLHVRRLQIAMDDPLLMCRFERFGNLLRDGEGFVNRQRPVCDPVCQRRALDQFHDQSRLHTVRLLQAVDRAMLGWFRAARTSASRWNLREALTVSGDRVREDFDRDLALQIGVGRAVDLAHSPDADAGRSLHTGRDGRRAGAALGSRGHVTGVDWAGQVERVARRRELCQKRHCFALYRIGPIGALSPVRERFRKNRFC